jgi:uncharacterized protein YndB with AHSA1/START domain
MNQENTVLMVQRKINASAERLFDAWTKPELMKQWFRGSEKKHVSRVETDLREGGAWLLDMNDGNGKINHCFGAYKVLDRPNKLVFTWSPTCGADDYMTTVTVLLKKVSDTVTELTLTHEGLRDETEFKNHNSGWDSCLNMLKKFGEQAG